MTGKIYRTKVGAIKVIKVENGFAYCLRFDGFVTFKISTLVRAIEKGMISEF